MEHKLVNHINLNCNSISDPKKMSNEAQVIVHSDFSKICLLWKYNISRSKFRNYNSIIWNKNVFSSAWSECHLNSKWILSSPSPHWTFQCCHMLISENLASGYNEHVSWCLISLYQSFKFTIRESYTVVIRYTGWN